MWNTAHSLQLSLVPVLLQSLGRENVHMVSNKAAKQHLLLYFFFFFIFFLLHSVFACCLLPSRQSTNLASSELYVCWALDYLLEHQQLMLGDDELMDNSLLHVSKTGDCYYSLRVRLYNRGTLFILFGCYP